MSLHLFPDRLVLAHLVDPSIPQSERLTQPAPAREPLLTKAAPHDCRSWRPPEAPQEKVVRGDVHGSDRNHVSKLGYGFPIYGTYNLLRGIIYQFTN